MAKLTADALKTLSRAVDEMDHLTGNLGLLFTGHVTWFDEGVEHKSRIKYDNDMGCHLAVISDDK